MNKIKFWTDRVEKLCPVFKKLDRKEFNSKMPGYYYHFCQHWMYKNFLLLEISNGKSHEKPDSKYYHPDYSDIFIRIQWGKLFGYNGAGIREEFYIDYIKELLPKLNYDWSDSFKTWGDCFQKKFVTTDEGLDLDKLAEDCEMIFNCCKKILDEWKEYGEDDKEKHSLDKDLMNPIEYFVR